MKTFQEFLRESSDYLYHATYTPRMESIGKNGLHGNSTHKNWDDSKKGVVYLAKNPEAAESYAETSDNVPEHYLDKITVLKVNKKHLDPNLLHKDGNVRNDDSDTVEYHGTIPSKHLIIHKE